MSIITKASAKAYFQTGLYPSQGNYADMIDSYLGLGEAVLQTVSGQVNFAGGVQVSGNQVGTGAYYNVGTSPNNIVQLNGSSQLPAVDGSLLTNIPGAVTLLSTQTISTSTASIQVTSGINSTYSRYVWEISNLTSVINNVDALITIQQGGVFVTATYSLQYILSSGSSLSTASLGGTSFNVTAGQTLIKSSSSAPSVIRFEFWNPSLSNPLLVSFESIFISTAYIKGGGNLDNISATTGIKLALSSGNIQGCTAKLYGIS